MPGIIGEALFVTNTADAAVLKSDAGRQAIARAYYQAIDAWYKPAPTPTAAGRSRAHGHGTAEVERGSSTRRLIALTFDAGASAAGRRHPGHLRPTKSARRYFLHGDWIQENPTCSSASWPSATRWRTMPSPS